ncbi:DNA polymerase ligase N-terminal domain-containing protein, partial [Cupriavidus sp. AcVe19-6a]|uniref:DNA polymerase ligase N-terminal domain-containing protein n=1 Tax=Cupriavidus sp. AcVe19-6a TaxID=2821358 RepID=UPI001B281516
MATTQARARAKRRGTAPSPALERYEQKRNFSVTPEPVAGRQRRKKPARLSFVIQKHWARRLHYDFRLELDEVLLSWAVPKGPSYDPAEKRIAVHVEDHPLDYAGFEGDIPPKQYGAGSVIVWDRGTWVP